MDRTGTSTVSLITCTAVPAQARSFVESEVASKLIAGSCVLLPNPASLEVHASSYGYQPCVGQV